MSVYELLDEAKRLQPVELRQLRRGLERLEKRIPPIVCASGGKQFRLHRIDDLEYFDSHQRSIAIEDDLGFLLQLSLTFEHSRSRLTFGEVYAALERLTGAGSRSYVEYKGSFAFPFELEVINGEQRSYYQLTIRNLKSSLDFPLRRFVDPDDKRLQSHTYFAPFADEFSRGEINHLILWLHGYLEGYAETIPEDSIKPFLQQVDSSLILFGHCDGGFFEEQFETQEEFDAARASWQAQIEWETTERLSTR